MKIKDIIDVDEGRKQLESDRITVGVSTCGISAGAKPTLEMLKNAQLDIPIDEVGCAGMCFNEPIVTVRQGGKLSIYSQVTEKTVGELINSIKSCVVEKSLFVGDDLSNIDYYQKQTRKVMSGCGQINPLSLNQYAAEGGFKGLENALSKKPEEVIEDIKNAGLRGRGGAGFPTGIKWEIISQKEGEKFIICNGDEGDPGAFMNRTLLESNPYKVLEGMIIGAYAIGASKAFIYTREEYPLAIKTIEKAIKNLEEIGLIGENILETGFKIKFYVKKGAGAFVCGEETSLMNSIMGYRGYPLPRPPYPAEKGLWDKPTNINNVGTFANVSLIMAEGVEEYKKVGTEKSRGTKIICLAGKINRPGVIEVPFGTPIRDIVYEIGGGVPEGTSLKAVQSGGPAGGCIPEYLIDTVLDYEDLSNVGSIMGSGGIVVMNNQDCMVDVARYFMKFTQQESCGKCTPCREGTMRLLELLEKITEGAATKRDLKLIKKLSGFVRDCSLCGLGQNAPNPVLSTLQYFQDEYNQHVKEKVCPSGICRNILKYNIEDECVGCGNCARVCPVSAISGVLKEKHSIEQDDCIKCGKCFDNCAFKAITKSGRKKD